MKNVGVTLFFVYFMSACGGGGGGEAQPVAQTSTASSSSSTASSSTSTSSSSSSSSAATNDTEFSNKSRVIDGYITGANVFIDFNFNLQQDAGEPSAIASSEAGVYEFDFDNGFSAITDFSLDCAKRRIQVAQVPAGATDSELGVVNKAYTMYHIPYGGNFVNITPFTGMFVDLLREAKKELETSLGKNSNESLAIKVADGCGSAASAMAAKLAAKSVTFASKLNTRGYAILKDLYGDYIASFDNQNKQKAEKIVDFLKAADDIRAAIKTHFNDKFEPSVALSEEAMDTVFGINDITALPISININHEGAVDSEGWQPTQYLSSSGLKVLATGKIAKATCTETDTNNCELFDPTYANIKKNLDWYLSYGGSVNDSLIPGVTIKSQFRDAKYTETNDINCQQSVELQFVAPKTCSGENCPQSLSREQKLTHNYGFEAWEGCTIFDNPYLYVFTEQQNIFESTKDHFGLQYLLKPNSNIYPNPPIDFMGASKNNVNHEASYNKMQSLLVDMDGLVALRNQLIEGEWISIELNKMNIVNGEEVNVKKMSYGLAKSVEDDHCWTYPINPQTNEYDYSNYRDTEVRGAGAYAACYDHINSFNFYN